MEVLAALRKVLDVERVKTKAKPKVSSRGTGPGGHFGQWKWREWPAKRSRDVVEV